jgi:nucleoside-diphosphate-sugar epimerase
VIHLAARVHVARETAADSLERYRRANTASTAALARAAALAGVRLFVFLSTAAVYGNGTFDRPLTEDDPLHPESPYARSKLEAEEELARIAVASGLSVVVLRPPMVYGPQAPGNFSRLVQLIRLGLPLPFARIDNRRSLVYVGNLASLILKVLDAPRAVGRTYLVADPEATSTPVLIQRIASVLGVPARLFPVPPSFLRYLGRASGRSREVRQLTQSLVLSTARARAELGWSAPFSLNEGLALSLAPTVGGK